ncbi:hypothetical protein L7F22_030812 [Adiantum nelumboides]|nr:hypothetical protein [Adiantum nelumboides]
MENRNEQLEVLKDVHEILTETMKIVANKPSVDLYFVQHIQKVVPSLLTIKHQITEAKVSADLATANVKDFLSSNKSMKDCGPLVTMIKALQIASTQIPTNSQSKIRELFHLLISTLLAIAYVDNDSGVVTLTDSAKEFLRIFAPFNDPKQPVLSFINILGNSKIVHSVLGYAQSYEKHYTIAEEVCHRFEAYIKSLDLIKVTDSQNLPYKLGLNQFVDLTWEEFKGIYMSSNEQNCFAMASLKSKQLQNITPSSTGRKDSSIFLGFEFPLFNASYSELDERDEQLGGCSVLCPSEEKNPKCGGQTCCVSNLGPGTSFREVVYFVAQSQSITNTSFDANIECHTMYATVFHPNYSDFSKKSYGIKLKWALPSNQTQSVLDLKRSIDFACSNNSNITIVQEVPGYYCSCPHGFVGDGYSQGLGCADIDECADPSLNDCILGKSTCQNIEGSYICKCKSKFHVGDGLGSGNGCPLSPSLRRTLTIVIGVIFVGLLLGGVVVFAIWWRRRTKRKYFLQNGGVQLQDMIVKAGGKWESRLFTAQELKEATETYADRMKLGMGGFGTVYKGVLSDGRLVAIKKANRAEGGNEQFLNELQILMHINHRNIVRLLGCCMETAMPLLVYEYVSHGNVRENLDEGGTGVMGWEQRLKVARQTAEALAYLHAAAFPPILHRDVKSANVLLDDNLDAKAPSCHEEIDR